MVPTFLFFFVTNLSYHNHVRRQSLRELAFMFIRMEGFPWLAEPAVGAAVPIRMLMIMSHASGNTLRG